MNPQIFQTVPVEIIDCSHVGSVVIIDGSFMWELFVLAMIYLYHGCDFFPLLDEIGIKDLPPWYNKWIILWDAVSVGNECWLDCIGAGNMGYHCWYIYLLWFQFMSLPLSIDMVALVFCTEEGTKKVFGILGICS